MDKNIWEEFLDWDNKNKNDSSDVFPEKKNIKIFMETSYCCHMSEYHYFIINRFDPLYFFIVKKGFPDEVSTIALRYLATKPIAEIMIPPINKITVILETQP